MRFFSFFQLLLMSLGFILVACDGFATNELYALTAFKQAIFEDPLLALSNWNSLDTDPCNWSGISCSMSQDHVLKINVSESSLSGFLAPELGLLSNLQELVLHGNTLIGVIPREIGMLKNLQVLDLGMNQLSGPIPPEIGNLTILVKINLQSNSLSGILPAELADLKYLEELRLDKNKLQGYIIGSNSSISTFNFGKMYASSWNTSGFCGSFQLKIADFSENLFIGTIPKCLSYLPRSSFQGNCLEDKDPKQRPASQCASAQPAKTHSGLNPNHKASQNRSKHEAYHSSSKPPWLLALEIVTVTIVGSLFFIALITAFVSCKRKPSIAISWKKLSSKKDNMSVYIDPKLLKNVPKFSRQELEEACEEFSNIIGSSPDSFIYKGTIKGGPEIAVISLCAKEERWTSYLELYFQREVADVARLNHENVGRLLGYCQESNPFTRMMVFEYASNGTLYEHLHYEEGCQLSWTRRMKIIIGIAQGLKYLHTEIDPPFSISELDSSAVYLTEDFSPKLVDFENRKSIILKSEKTSVSVNNQGAVCVLPNSLEPRHLDIQANVYAFGVLMLEIISGNPRYCKDKGFLVDWAKKSLELPEEMCSVVDPELKHFKSDELQVIREVISLCIYPYFPKQKSMQDICEILESGIDTSVSAQLQASSLAWAELALSSS